MAMKSTQHEKMFCCVLKKKMYKKKRLRLDDPWLSDRGPTIIIPCLEPRPQKSHSSRTRWKMMPVPLHAELLLWRNVVRNLASDKNFFSQIHPKKQKRSPEDQCDLKLC